MGRGARRRASRLPHPAAVPPLRYGKHGRGLKFTRFADGYVRANYDAAPMVGPRGGGFVFDTNAVHKGEVRGDFERTTVILEFHAHNKIRPLDGAGVPCPSAERGKRENANGVAGWPLYPPEKRRGRKK